LFAEADLAKHRGCVVGIAEARAELHQHMMRGFTTRGVARELQHASGRPDHGSETRQSCRSKQRHYRHPALPFTHQFDAEMRQHKSHAAKEQHGR